MRSHLRVGLVPTLPATFLLPFTSTLMAASFQGSAEISSASPYALTDTRKPGKGPSPPAQDASSSIRTILSLFAIPEAQREEEPPAKRRKVADGSAVSIQSLPEVSDKNSIVLAHMCLELVGTYILSPRC